MADKLTIAEFASRIRQRDPAFESVPDDVLVRKVLERKPEMASFLVISEPRSPITRGTESTSRAGDYAYEALAGPARAAKGILWDFPKAVLFPDNPLGIAGDLGKQLVRMLDAGAQSAESGEGRAGQTLSMMENAPLIGEMTKRVEKAGPGRFNLSPEAVGAATEGAGYMLAPEIAKATGRAGIMSLQRMAGAGKEPVMLERMRARTVNENRMAAYERTKAKIAESNQAKLAEHEAKTAEAKQVHQEAEQAAQAKYQQELADYQKSSAEKKAEHAQKVQTARREWVEKTAKARAAEREAAKVDARRETLKRAKSEYGERLLKNIKDTFQTSKQRLDSRWTKLRATTINRGGKLSVLNDELGNPRAIQEGVAKAEKEFLQGSPGSLKQFRDLTNWIERESEKGTFPQPSGPLKPPTWAEMRTHYSSMGDAMYGSDMPSNVYRAMKYVREEVLGKQLNDLAKGAGVGDEYGSLLQDHSQFEKDWKNTRSVATGGGSPLAHALRAPNAATLEPQVLGKTGDLLLERLGRYTDAGASPATASAIRKLNSEINNLPTVRIPQAPGKLELPSEPKLGEPPEAKASKPFEPPEAPKLREAVKPPIKEADSPAAIRRKKILQYTSRPKRISDFLPPNLIAEPLLSFEGIRELVANFPRKEYPLPPSEMKPPIKPGGGESDIDMATRRGPGEPPPTGGPSLEQMYRMVDNLKARYAQQRATGDPEMFKTGSQLKDAMDQVKKAESQKFGSTPQASPQTLSNKGGGGLNYTAEDLAKLKADLERRYGKQ